MTMSALRPAYGDCDAEDVLMSLAHRHDERDGLLVFWSVEAIAEDACLSVPRVRRALRLLERSDLISQIDCVAWSLHLETLHVEARP